MIKIFLIYCTLFLSVSEARQIVLVVADDFNSTTAKLYAYENTHPVFKGIRVNVGRNGLAWDVNDHIFLHKKDAPIKHEGDGKAPAGVFEITQSFGYGDENFSLPYMKSSQDIICVDDVNSSFYNSIVSMPSIVPNSFEKMKRDDDQYKIGAVVAYNTKRVKGLGSCIFLHVEKFQGHPTAGCTSMAYEDLEKILKWLDKKEKPLLVQIPKEYLLQAKKRFALQ